VVWFLGVRMAQYRAMGQLELIRSTSRISGEKRRAQKPNPILTLKVAPKPLRAAACLA
jgi:hypothetical protein